MYILPCMLHESVPLYLLTFTCDFVAAVPYVNEPRGGEKFKNADKKWGMQ